MPELSRKELDELAEFSAMSQEQVEALLITEQSDRKREFERQLADAGSCYTPELLESVIREFAIPTDKLPELGLRLSCAALLYRDRKAEREKAETARYIAKQISNIEKIARDLQSALAALSPDASSCMWPEPGEIERTALANNESKSRYGHTIMWVRSGHAVEFQYLRPHQIIESVEILANLAAAANRSLPRDKGGRPSDEALWMWVVYMQNFWVKLLGQKFTYYAHLGEGVTSAFRFCQALLGPLDPHVTGTQLGTAMRHAIRLSKREPPR